MSELAAKHLSKLQGATRGKPLQFACYFDKQVVFLAIKAGGVPKLPSPEEALKSSTLGSKESKDAPSVETMKAFKGRVHHDSGTLYFMFAKTKPRGNLCKLIRSYIKARTKTKFTIVIGDDLSEDMPVDLERKTTKSLVEEPEITLSPEMLGSGTDSDDEFLSEEESIDFEDLELQQSVDHASGDIDKIVQLLKDPERMGYGFLKQLLANAKDLDLPRAYQTLAETGEYGWLLFPYAMESEEGEEWLKTQLKGEKGWRPDIDDICRGLPKSIAVDFLKRARDEDRENFIIEISKCLLSTSRPWHESPEAFYPVMELVSVNELPQHGLLTSAYEAGKYELVIELLKKGFDCNAFQDKGPATGSSDRSIVGQICEDLANKKGSLDKLIRAVQERGGDLLTWNEVCQSSLVKKATLMLESDQFKNQPCMFYGFEAMRLPYVEAVKSDGKDVRGLLRMKDMWDIAVKLARSSRFTEIQEGGSSALEKLIDDNKSKLKLQTKDLDQVFDYLSFVIRPEEDLFHSVDSLEKKYLNKGNLIITRLCKKGVDWVCQRGGVILSVIDDVDEDDLLNYRDLKRLRIAQMEDSLGGRIPLRKQGVQKIITYSEIRHMLRNYQSLRKHSGGVFFFHLGQELTEQEVHNLRCEFERVNIGTIPSDDAKTEIPKILRRSSELWNLSEEDANSILENDVPIEALREFMELSLRGQQIAERLKSDPEAPLSKTSHRKLSKIRDRVTRLLSQSEWKGIGKKILESVLESLRT